MKLNEFTLNLKRTKKFENTSKTGIGKGYELVQSTFENEWTHAVKFLISFLI